MGTKSTTGRTPGADYVGTNRTGRRVIDGEEKDLFFHGNELQGVEYGELKVGDRMSFDKADSEKGPNATNVTRI